MSYNFYSLVSSIKDKSSQAMATLSSDLKEFTSIVQEDVAEVAKTVRKTVHEQSETLRQRVEEQPKADDDDEGQDAEGDHHLDDGDGQKEHRADDAPVTPEDDEEDDADAGKTMDRRGSLTSMFSFAGLSLEAVGSKILQSADGLLDTLARAGAVDGEIDDEDDDEEEDKLASARRYRLLALQEDEHTYLLPPMDVETFKKWRTALTEEELASIQEEVLAHYPTVAHKLAELVPDAVSMDDFWAHYIYKASLLAAQEQRGADLLEHALNDSDEEIGWDADSPRNAGDDNVDNDGRFPTYEEPHADDALPILEEMDAPEPSSPAPVLEEQRPLPPDTDDEAPIDSISSDGESWIELDEQREARRDAAQPPLSSSSSSSFVPVYGPRDGVYNVVAGGDSKAAAAAVGASSATPAAATTARVREDDEEDVDWGDDDDGDAPASKPPGDAGAGSSDAPETKARAADWGEWD